MKNILLLFTGILVTFTVSGQITLTSGSYPSSVIGTDSLKMTTATSSFPALTAMADGIWDMSIVTDTTPTYFAYRVPTLTYQFADSNYYNFSGYSYQGNVQSSVTATGIIEYGIDIQRAAYGLATITFNPTDSFIINAQNALFSSSHTKIAFPASYHTFWTSVYNFDIDFQISIAALSLSNAPGIVRTYTTEKDSVKGWGKMRVKDINGIPSGYSHVLQVQTMRVDSTVIFINGILASPAILLTLGLTQGQKTTTYQQNYYRPQEVTPLAQVTFSDSTFTQAKSATTHVQRLAPSVVANVFNKTSVKVFPNPVTNGIVSLELPATNGVWAYELIDINGKKVAGGPLQTKDKIAKCLLPASVLPGTYYLEITNDDRQVSIVLIEVVR